MTGLIPAAPSPGTFDLTVLDQARVWREADGRTRPLASLSADEVRAVHAFLVSHAELLWLSVLRREVFMRLATVAVATPAPHDDSRAGHAEPVNRWSSNQERANPRPPWPPSSKHEDTSSDQEEPSPPAGAEDLWSPLGQGPHGWLVRTALVRALDALAQE